MKDMNEVKAQFVQLVEIMEKLRSPDGCPWDREQTYESLRQYLLEETYEVLELIDAKKYDDLQKELGDLLLQVIFQSQIAEEENRFSIVDVLKNINQKLIYRHSNVFGDVKINNAAEQTINWEQMKKKEDQNRSAIDGVPKQLCALLQAHRIQAKAATVGFDWENAQQVRQKLAEELTELDQAIIENNPDAIEMEFGDLLFTMVNLSRFLNVNPEDALRKATRKFSARFREMEKKISLSEQSMPDMSLEQMDKVWDEVKALL